MRVAQELRVSQSFAPRFLYTNYAADVTCKFLA